MIIKVLAENTSEAPQLQSEHGLSLLIETERHKILFDTGASDLFIRNAGKMGVDLQEVDIMIISHGHSDHGGGLKAFMELNTKAPVYIEEKAFLPHYSGRMNGDTVSIGLDRNLLPNERFIFCRDELRLDDELTLFAAVKGTRLLPSGNATLYQESAGGMQEDDFAHEQNLLIRYGNKLVLIAGCAHRGILNIVERGSDIMRKDPDYVIGGFHLSSAGMRRCESPEFVGELAVALLETGAQYYTCHCTGIESYDNLRMVMGDNIEYLSTGDQLTIYS